MKTFIPKLAIALLSLVVPALADGWTCAGRNYEGVNVRAQARHWVGEGNLKGSDFRASNRSKLHFFEVGEGLILTESCTGVRAYCTLTGDIYNLRYLDQDTNEWNECDRY
ncbi:CSEP0266 putative effector protein [Blumeria hordei DH14]|uniref:CSEP0266 putative effector protein n=1 Tax=Blumeria graminis f. sp. hordei (strain DH14) TaxID=546991 RepID=N1J9J7_BLUG1|nr:CSEP0266 putative effector protein [Blumeria hordei DH14]